MRVVADTNTVVSGLLWYGPPREVLDAARSGKIELFTSSILLAELEDVLSRNKLSKRLKIVGTTPLELVRGYVALGRLVTPLTINPVILEDPDDDHVLACAIAAQADVIASGDRHLLSLKNYEGIDILKPAELVARIPVNLYHEGTDEEESRS
jgi:putative PIN family toxin of toxin-antitoxin system